MIEANELTKYYGGKAALQGVNLQAAKGKAVAIVGPNGAGKTTLLRILNLLERPASGELRFDGHLIVFSKRNLNLRRRMTLLGQNPFLFNTTVVKNIIFGLSTRGLSAHEMSARAAEALELVGLSGFENRNARGLSGGEVQRVAFARAIALKPEVLLLDEVTANVDAESAGKIAQAIAEFKMESDALIIMSSHDSQIVYRIADEIYLIYEGKIAKTSAENLFRGEIIRADGLKCIIVGGQKIFLVTDKIGPGAISIDPREVILSRGRLESSARNSIKGRISSLAARPAEVAVKVDAGVVFEAVITKQSFQEMDLKLGDEIWLTFKSSAVKVF